MSFWFLCEKDKVLDAVIACERDLRAACNLVSILSSAPNGCLPIYHLSRHRGQLGLPHDLKLSTFIRRYPTIFHESYVFDSAGTRVPCFELTLEALNLHHEELGIIRENVMDLINRLRKLLMLSKDRALPLQTIDQLKWDLGLPYDYCNSLIPKYADIFSLFRLPDDRFGLKLLSWNDTLVVSQLENLQTEDNLKNSCLAFPIWFTRGFGLKRKCMEWLREWQKLPYTYTSPYADASHLDPRTDVSEKRIVGVFHELLHLKKSLRQNVSNLRKPLSLPQKFTKVFERHPGIFYISKMSDTQTVVLREAYECQQLIQRHPIVDVRERFASMVRNGFLDRSRGLYKKTADVSRKDPSKIVRGHKGFGDGFDSELESDYNLFSEYDSDDSIHHQGRPDTCVG
ncbi:F-box protein CPR30 [Hibiscus syriacus]|uniref:F-box protein CPR30 n=1 Tax=Hibiscus syriacus TaxID=106335 RepID=A0A6A2Z1M2_HIBSY|nr:F-box protein CPR30 [Hibiscus syriacus]